MPERFKLPRSITGRTWQAVHSGLWRSPPRGMVARDDMTIAPLWTCREAVAVVAALEAVAPRGSFALWYQFAAIGYGWSPSRDRLNRSRWQADSYYPAEASVLLQAELQRVTGDLDDGAYEKEPRLDLDEAAFDDPGLQGRVQKALRQDGAVARWVSRDVDLIGEENDPSAQMPVPMPACKDPKTGKPVMPKLNPKTGKFECPGGVVVIDDPLTAIIKSLATIAVPIAIVVVAVAVVGERTSARKRRK